MRLLGKTGEIELNDEFVAAFRTLRADADVEFAKMRIWLELNRARRPANIERFVAAWFKRTPAPRPASDSARNRSVVMGAIFKPREVIDVEPEPVTRRLG